MSILCSKCGGTAITCEAMIDPNTKRFDHYTDESFLYGWCNGCKTGTVLTDVDEVKNEMVEKYRTFVQSNGFEPQYADCRIAWKDTRDTCDVRIMLSAGIDSDDIFYNCSSLNGLLSLAEYGNEDFLVTECHRFAVLTERETMSGQVFEYEMEGRTMSVTGKEVMDFYGEHYGLRKEEIERYAARYACRIKYYRECCNRLLDKTLVKKLLDGEMIMKKGEKDSFRLQLTFVWYVEIIKEDDSRYKPFRYILKACCLDNPQTFDRRYITLEAALLHCLNGFNENVHIHNRYATMEEYLKRE